MAATENEGYAVAHRYKARHTTECGSQSHQTTHDNVEVTCTPCLDAMLRSVSIPAAGVAPRRPPVTLGMVPPHVLPAPALLTWWPAHRFPGGERAPGTFMVYPINSGLPDIVSAWPSDWPVLLGVV